MKFISTYLFILFIHLILRSKFTSLHHTRENNRHHEGDDSNNIGIYLFEL